MKEREIARHVADFDRERVISMRQSAKCNSFQDVWRWHPAMASALRNPFARSENVTANFSQAFQDIFVLSMLGGMEGGTYLEIGAHHPTDNNNTFLLHQNYGWRGISVDIDASHRILWRKMRPRSRLVIGDALTIDYREALPHWFVHLKKAGWQSFLPRLWPRAGLEGVRRIDYLQLDIEPSAHTLAVLKALPLDACRFSVITFETDIYAGDPRARDESRALLYAQGYQLIGPDVSVLYAPISSEPIPFEDWWVDPQVVPSEVIQRAKRALCFEGNLLPQKLLFDR